MTQHKKKGNLSLSEQDDLYETVRELARLSPLMDKQKTIQTWPFLCHRYGLMLDVANTRISFRQFKAKHPRFNKAKTRQLFHIPPTCAWDDVTQQYRVQGKLTNVFANTLDNPNQLSFTHARKLLRDCYPGQQFDGNSEIVLYHFYVLAAFSMLKINYLKYEMHCDFKRDHARNRCAVYRLLKEVLVKLKAQRK